MFLRPNVRQILQRLYVLGVYCIVGAIILVLWNYALPYFNAAEYQEEVYTRPTPQNPKCPDHQFLDHTENCKPYKCENCADHSCQLLNNVPICTKCAEKYILDFEYKMINGENKTYGVCKECPLRCKKCTSRTDCKECMSGWELRGKECVGFDCESGEEVGTNKRCNLAWECSDGSDEFLCPAPKSTLITYIECPDKKGWFSQNKKCNGIPDCLDGSDELGCPCRDDYFHCLDKKGCFKMDKIRDGTVHCRDASDEGDHHIHGLPGNYTMRGSDRTRSTYVEAMRFCKSIGRIMLQLYSDEQVEAIKKYYALDSKITRYWIGAQDRDNNAVWTWNDNGHGTGPTNLTYTAWAPYNDDFQWDTDLGFVKTYGQGQCAYLMAAENGRQTVYMYNQDCYNVNRVICMSEDAWVAPDKSIPCVYCTPGKVPPHGTISLLPANTTASKS